MVFKQRGHVGMSFQVGSCTQREWIVDGGWLLGYFWEHGSPVSARSVMKDGCLFQSGLLVPTMLAMQSVFRHCTDVHVLSQRLLEEIVELTGSPFGSYSEQLGGTQRHYCVSLLTISRHLAHPLP